MKFKKDDMIIEVSDPNTYNVFERAGFEKVEEEEKKADKKKEK